MAQIIRKLAKLISLCMVVSLVFTTCVCEGSPNEYDVKAAFLYQFANFVEWPSGSFSSSSSPIVIGVLGDDPFGDKLDDTVRGKTVDGRKITIKRSDDVKDLTSCHIVFISSSASGRLSKIIDRLRSESILTVGETDQFASHGGIIGFVIHDNKIGLQINVEAAKKAKLKISSKLLRLAEVVGD